MKNRLVEWTEFCVETFIAYPKGNEVRIIKCGGKPFAVVLQSDDPADGPYQAVCGPFDVERKKWADMPPRYRRNLMARWLCTSCGVSTNFSEECDCYSLAPTYSVYADEEPGRDEEPNYSDWVGLFGRFWDWDGGEIRCVWGFLMDFDGRGCERPFQRETDPCRYKYFRPELPPAHIKDL